MARGWHYSKLSLSSPLFPSFTGMCFVIVPFFLFLSCSCSCFVFMLSLELCRCSSDVSSEVYITVF